MKPKSTILKFLFACFVIVHSLTAGSQIKKTFLIKNPSQLSAGSIYYSGCGTQYYADDFMLGFKWNDDLPPGSTITDVKIEVNIGMEYNPGFKFTTLNGIGQGDLYTEPYYDCPDRTFITQPDYIDPSAYSIGSQNEFLFMGLWGSTYLCKTPDLSNSFARITVSYFPSFTGFNAPTVSAFTPTDANPCSTITVFGTHFDNQVSYVLFNGTPASSFTVVSPTELSATIPANATSGLISVYNDGGYAVSIDNFTVDVPNAPVIYNVTPLSGGPSTHISITGSNLCCVVDLNIGGTPPASYTLVNPNLITAVIGYGSSGDISVTTPGGNTLFSAFNYITPPASTQMNISGSSSTDSVIANVASIVDSNLVVTGNGLITDFTVSISDTYTDGDALGYTGDLPAAITTEGFNTVTGVIVFKGSLLASDWQSFLRKVSFTSTSSVCFPEKRKVSFTAGNKFYNPLTGHFYEYVQTGIRWTEARDAAASRSYYGRQGYLATVTSQAENNFIWKVMSASAWLGGTDNFNEINTALDSTAYPDAYASEGHYYWVTGPEKGTPFSNQNAYEPGGVQPVNGRYSNWSGGEPNDWPDYSPSSPGQEDYLQIYAELGSSGTWNDLSNDNGLSYLIEYGGMPGDDLSNQVLFTREIFVSGSSSGTITGGNVIVCEGSNTTTLTLTNFTGTVEYWEYSSDNFFTPGTPVFNNTNTLTVTDLASSMYYRAVVTSSSPAACSGLTTASVKITVAVTEPGSILAGSNTICEGASADLTLFGNAGNVLQWEVADNAGFSGATTINNTTTHVTYALSTAGTYYFRAQVQNNGCGTPVWSAGRMITVNSGTPPVGGNVNNAEHTFGAHSGTLTLSGSTGDVVKWQSSVDNGLVWSDVPSTDTWLDYTVSVTTKFRAIISNAGCGTANSNAGTVTILNANQYKWYGFDNTDWATTNNWLSASRPGSGAEIIFSENALNNLVLDQDYDVNSIDFSGSGKKMVLGDHNLSVTTLTGVNSTSYIRTDGAGKLRMSITDGASVAFPVGNSAFNPVSVTNHSGNADDFTVRVLDEVYTNGSNGLPVNTFRVQRTWDIGKTNPNGGSGLDFTFSWNNGEVSNPMSIPSLFHYEGGWNKQTGITFSTPNTLAYTGYTGTFSPFSVMDGGTTLPVTWLSFTARKLNSSVMLNWSTATEHNSDKFTVQHSVNGIDWSNAGTRTAAGFSTMPQTYSFEHLNPVTGANYYRLIQHDLDGRQTYSKILRLNFTDAVMQMLLYPNPVTDGILNVRLEKAATLMIFNSAGATVMEREMQAGVSILDLSKLAKGVYSIKAGEENAFVVIR